MILGTKARYGVMAMVDIATQDENTPISVNELSSRQNITAPYLEQIFRKLKSAGLVKSVRGPGGGYMLTRKPTEIYISEIVEAVDESIRMTRCDPKTKDGCIAGKARCQTHNLWYGLSEVIHDYLAKHSLSDVINKSNDFR
ncbi:MAG: Rrf2 family transcriptional regulator [Rickettsiales bacterium]